MVEEEEGKNGRRAQDKRPADRFPTEKLTYVQDHLAVEEDAKRRMLLRYIHSVKEHAMSMNDGSKCVAVA